MRQYVKDLYKNLTYRAYLSLLEKLKVLITRKALYELLLNLLQMLKELSEKQLLLLLRPRTSTILFQGRPSLKIQEVLLIRPDEHFFFYVIISLYLAQRELNYYRTSLQSQQLPFRPTYNEAENSQLYKSSLLVSKILRKLSV